MKTKRQEFITWEKAIASQINTLIQIRKCLLDEVKANFAHEKALRKSLATGRAAEKRIKLP